MTLDEVGRLIAEGPGSREVLRKVTGEFGEDPVPWNVLNAGRAYGWSAERTLGALALFLCWHRGRPGGCWTKPAPCRCCLSSLQGSRP